MAQLSMVLSPGPCGSRADHSDDDAVATLAAWRAYRAAPAGGIVAQYSAATIRSTARAIRRTSIEMALSREALRGFDATLADASMTRVSRAGRAALTGEEGTLKGRMA